MGPGRLFVLTLCVLLLIGAAWAFFAFRKDLGDAQIRLNAYPAIKVQTTLGPIETLDSGDGFPVLSIHGTGGGYDQGFEMASGLYEAGYRVIAPSRFGYLGAPVPDLTDAAAQADMLAALLDTLGVERAVIMGTSAGAVTALHFAARHPDRTAALLPMVPAYFPPEQTAPEPWSPLKTFAITRALRSDLVFWLGLRLAPNRMASTILATDLAILENVEHTERARLDAILWGILPISARAEGLILDAQHTASPLPVPFDRITAPTLAASAEDDLYSTSTSARLIADQIADAELFITPDGGHVWAGRRDEVWDKVLAFLAASGISP